MMVGSWWFPWCLHIPRCPDPKRTGPNRNKKQPVGIGYVIFSPGMLIRNCFYSPLLHENNFSKMSQFLLLMEEILYHLLSMLMIRPLKKMGPHSPYQLVSRISEPSTVSPTALFSSPGQGAELLPNRPAAWVRRFTAYLGVEGMTMQVCEKWTAKRRTHTIHVWYII